MCKEAECGGSGCGRGLAKGVTVIDALLSGTESSTEAKVLARLLGLSWCVCGFSWKADEN